MKQLILFLFCIISIICYTQTNKNTTTKRTVTTTIITPAAKPVVTATVKTNIAGSFYINYEINKAPLPLKAGKVFFALDNNLVVISPSESKLKDVNSLRMLIDLKESEMTMLTIDIKNKKNGLLTKFPKPLLNKSLAAKKTPVVTKTGVFKTIEGFKCEKTLINFSDSLIAVAYITNDIIIDVANLIAWSNSSLRTKSPFAHLIFEIKGTVLESTFTHKNGEISKLIISDIKKDKPAAAAFSSNGYNIMDARGLPMFNNAQ